MNIYFILWFAIQGYFIYFLAQTVPALASRRSSFHWFHVSVIPPSLCVRVFVCTRACVCAHHMMFVLNLFQAHLTCFLLQSEKSAISPRSSGSFYWQIVLETNIWITSPFYLKLINQLVFYFLISKMFSNL